MMTPGGEQKGTEGKQDDSPRSDVDNFTLADLIDAPALQTLMKGFYELTKVPMSIIDMQGSVLVGVGWQEICTAFHRLHPETCRHCLESDIELTKDIKEGEFRIYKCKNNMWDAASPLVIDGRKMGHLFTGQFFFDDEIPDEAFYRRQASRFGFDADRYIAALRGVPRLGREKVAKGMNFLHGLADLISQNTHSRLKLAGLLRQQTQAEDAMRRSEKMYRTLARNLPGGAAFILDQDLRYVLAGGQALQAAGFTPGDFEGRTIWQALGEELAGQYEPNLRQALAGNTFRYEHAGHGRQYVSEGVPIRDDRGAVTGILVTSFDISERKQAEENLRRLNESLEQRVSERTRQVSRQADQLRALAARLARTEQRERKRLSKILHDHIQQLIVAARMQLNWMPTETDPHRCRAAAQAADAILNEALEDTRSLAVDLSPPVLHEAGLTGGLSWLTTRMRDKYQFSVHLTADSSAEPAAEEIRCLLFECVRELLFNAVKHAGVSEAAVALARTPNGSIQLTVSDRGRGFDPEMLNNRQADEVTFGLFSIREQLAHLGGRLQIDSAPGRGSCFTLTVPAATAAEASPNPPAEGVAELPDRDAPAPSCRVMVCDDHKIVREGLARLLQFEPGIEVVAQAADGRQAVDLAHQLLPDVILMDVNLGDITGVEAATRILTVNPRIKIIGLSMHDDAAVAKAMHDAGAVAYLNKANASRNLIKTVKACQKTASPTDKG